jgi:hypothetical protein
MITQRHQAHIQIRNQCSITVNIFWFGEHKSVSLEYLLFLAPFNCIGEHNHWHVFWEPLQCFFIVFKRLNWMSALEIYVCPLKSPLIGKYSEDSHMPI